MQIIPLNAANSRRHPALSGAALAAHRVPDARDTERAAAGCVYSEPGAAHAKVPGRETRAGVIAENIARCCAKVVVRYFEQETGAAGSDARRH